MVVTGGRDWEDAARVESTLFSVLADREDVAVGDCPSGVDLIVRCWCAEVAVACRVFWADWDRYGNRAGPLRNLQMVREARPRLVLAFWDGKSRGTQNCIREAVLAGVSVRIVPMVVRRDDALG